MFIIFGFVFSAFHLIKNGNLKDKLFKHKFDHLYDSLNINKGICKYYLCIIYVRKLCFSIVIVFLFKYPIIQLVLISVFNLSIFFVNVILSPSTYNKLNYINRISELILVINQVIICTYLNFDEPDDQRTLKGWINIGLWSFIIVLHLGYYICLAIQGLISFVKKYKKKNRK